LRFIRIALFSAAIGVVLSVVGAFGAGGAPLAPRTALFVAFSLYAGFLGFGVSAWMARQGWAAGRPAVQIGVVAAIMTVIMGLSTWASFIILTHAGMNARALGNFMVVSLVMSLAMTGLSFAVFRPTPVTHAAAAGAPAPKFLARLPVRLRGAVLWALEAEDHYLRVHTSRGDDLILMRLSDAIGELEGLEGAQTHRSWWVARIAVTDVKRGDGRATITLPDGTEAPVSRTFARTLRETGWF
jgi:DNA-binding LytR/AlgR family response regulator